MPLTFSIFLWPYRHVLLFGWCLFKCAHKICIFILYWWSIKYASVTLPRILKQNPGFSSCCNHNYKPLGQSGNPMTFTSRSPVWLSRYLRLEIEISLFVFLTVFLTLQSIGENEFGKIGHSKIFTFLRDFMIFLKRNLFRASILHHITDTDNT